MRNAPGIEPYHARDCPARNGGKCKRQRCSYRAKARGERSPRFPTLAEAKEWRRDRLAQATRHRHRGPVAQDTLADAWALWHRMAKSGALHSRSNAAYKPSTLRDYDEAMRKRVLPDYGANRLADISADGLKRLVRDLREASLSGSAIRNTINPLRALFRDADEIIDGWRGPDPTTGLRLPKVTSRRRSERIPAPAQTAKLVAFAPERDRAIWATACYAGLRRGELRALRRKDIDLANSTIRVRRSWDRVERAIEPKSDAGERDVPILAALRPILEVHLGSMAEKSAEALLFGTKTGSAFDPGDVSKRAAKAWKDKAAAFTLHECRHGFASVCIEAGVNAKRIQTWMGHSSIATTFDLYGRLLDRSEAEAVSRVDDYLAVGQPVGPEGADEGGSERTQADVETTGRQSADTAEMPAVAA